jgi:hypothetical protein
MAGRAREPAAGELQSLNAAEFDVEEVEQRLELATAVPNDDCWTNICLVHV